jgi:hypothetical protein
MTATNKTTLSVLEDLKAKLFHVRSPEDIAAFKAELDLLISETKESLEPAAKEASASKGGKEPPKDHPKEQTVAVKKTTY